MTVSEAIAALQQYDRDAPLMVCITVEKTGEVVYTHITSISLDEPGDTQQVVAANTNFPIL